MGGHRRQKGWGYGMYVRFTLNYKCYTIIFHTSSTDDDDEDISGGTSQAVDMSSFDDDYNVTDETVER